MIIRLSCVFLILLTCPSLCTLYGQEKNNSQPSALTDTSQINLTEFAATIAKGAGTDYDRAERLLNWLSHNFKWLSTDYKKRTVKEIIARQGGNCFELAAVFMSLIKTLGIRYRQVAEINLQPRSERRQKSAEELVSKRGNSGSVFGEQHNDHRWVEIYDEKSRAWIPADPSVGVIGLEPWLKSRVWFGERWAIDTSITNDMIVPIAIFTTDSTYKMIEPRTAHYLVQSFNKLYDGKLSHLPSWRDWTKALTDIEGKCKSAFEGRVNLHMYRKDIARLASIYDKLKMEYKTGTRVIR